MDNVKELLERSSKGDVEARNEVVNNNLNLCRSVAKKFMNRGYEFEELFQVGCIGLIKAAKNFNTSYNVQFSTYAVPLIMGEIQRFIRDDNPIHISRRLKELSILCMKQKERIENENNREARVSEIAEACNVTVQEVSEALTASCPPDSIYREVISSDDKSVLLMEKIPCFYEEENINKIMLCQIMDNLNEREKIIINLRYMNGKTQAEISEILGISQVQVSRLEKKILLKMRQQCE